MKTDSEEIKFAQELYVGGHSRAKIRHILKRDRRWLDNALAGAIRATDYEAKRRATYAAKVASGSTQKRYEWLPLDDEANYEGYYVPRPEDIEAAKEQLRQKHLDEKLAQVWAS